MCIQLRRVVIAFVVTSVTLVMSRAAASELPTEPAGAPGWALYGTSLFTATPEPLLVAAPQYPFDDDVRETLTWGLGNHSRLPMFLFDRMSGSDFRGGAGWRYDSNTIGINANARIPTFGYRDETYWSVGAQAAGLRELNDKVCIGIVARFRADVPERNSDLSYDEEVGRAFLNADLFGGTIAASYEFRREVLDHSTSALRHAGILAFRSPEIHVFEGGGSAAGIGYYRLEQVTDLQTISPSVKEALDLDGTKHTVGFEAQLFNETHQLYLGGDLDSQRTEGSEYDVDSAALNAVLRHRYQVDSWTVDLIGDAEVRWSKYRNTSVFDVRGKRRDFSQSYFAGVLIATEMFPLNALVGVGYNVNESNVHARRDGAFDVSAYRANIFDYERWVIGVQFELAFSEVLTTLAHADNNPVKSTPNAAATRAALPTR